MNRRGLSMRKIKEILRLHYEHNLSNRGIGRSCNVSPSTVGEYIQRSKAAGLDYSMIYDHDDNSIYGLLYPEEVEKNPAVKKMPDMSYLHKELKQKGVTLQLLWEEYKTTNPEGYNRTQFFYLYSEWRKRLHPVPDCFVDLPPTNY